KAHRTERNGAHRIDYASEDIRRGDRGVSPARRSHGRRMTTRVREIPGPAGRLETLLEEPPPYGGVNNEGLVERGRADGGRAAVVIAHPHPQYGGSMHTKVVYQAAKAFTRIGCAVLRFNFRGVGTSEGSWDDGRGELDDFRAGLAFMRTRYPSVRLW